MDAPLISIIAINYNSTEDTLEFLESVYQTSFQSKEVIVIDNASRENPEKEISLRFPLVTFIRSEANLGFAGGNNLGLKSAKGKYLFLLNNDTLLPNDFFEPIITFMDAHSEAGMASPKILYPDNKTIQFVGSVGINPYTGRGKRIAYMEEDKGQYDRCYETDLAHGAALVVPRVVIDKVGPMPEEFFLYYEEHDWCEKIKRAGFKIFYIGDSKIFHKGSVSVGDHSPLKVYYLTRNRLLFMRRNFRGLQFYSGLVFFIALTVPKQTLSFLLRGKFKLLNSFYSGMVWNMKN
jgi:GT2 family glycosyltransferase